jgi:hypothetical protein
MMQKLEKLIDTLTKLAEIAIAEYERVEATAGRAPAPEPVEEAKKRTRRTKEQIAAEEAAAKQKAASVNPPAPVTPAAEAAAAPAADPFGDTGPAVGIQPVAAPAAAPAAAVPTMDEKQSYDKLLEVLGAYAQLAKNDTPNGQVQIKAHITAQFNVAKIADLTHDQRLLTIRAFEAMIVGYKKPAGVK